MKTTNKRAAWLAEMEIELVKLSPAHAGKVNWDAAIFHFNQGRTPLDAAKRIAETEMPIDRR